MERVASYIRREHGTTIQVYTGPCNQVAALRDLYLGAHELRRGFEAAREAAGMPWLWFLDLRRTFGSWIVQETRSLKAAQDLLGHTTPPITAKHYAHLLDDHLEDAIAELPAIGVGQKWVKHQRPRSRKRVK